MLPSPLCFVVCVMSVKDLWQCLGCHMQFTFLSLLGEHISWHIQTHKDTCCVCGLGLANRKELAGHVMTHVRSGERAYLDCWMHTSQAELQTVPISTSISIPTSPPKRKPKKARLTARAESSKVEGAKRFNQQ